MKMQLAAMLLLVAPLPAAAAPYANPLSDEQLSTLRGGFTLPGGLQVGLGVTTESRIDGQLVLRSTFTLGAGAESLQVEARSSDGSLHKIDVSQAGTVTGSDGTLTVVRKNGAASNRRGC